jgi:hypothetical protein
VPSLLTRSGVDVAPWVGLFVALGAGGAIGYFLSRCASQTFEALSSASDQMSRGDLRPLRESSSRRSFPTRRGTSPAASSAWRRACASSSTA